VRSARLALPWVIDARTDLGWFVGGALLSLAFLAALLASAHPETIWLAWATLVDTPHYFGTYSRTYLDPAERTRLRGRLLGSLGLLAVGPVAVGLCAVLHRAGVAAYRAPLVALLLAFNVWAYWHLVRQHHGIAGLYRRRAGEGDRDRRIDTWFVHGTLLGAFALLVLGHPEARTALGLGPERGPWDRGATLAAWGVVAASTLAFVARQLERWRAGEPVSATKLLYLLSVVGTYVFLCTYEGAYRLPLFVWSGTITIGHDLEYQALVWYHHRNHFGHAAMPPPFRTRSLLRFLACATAMGLLLRGLGTSLGVFAGVPPLWDSGTVTLFGDVLLRDLFLSVMLGVAMHHYYLDQIIWRPGKDGALRRDLRLPA